jgi:hypothetical protein
MKPKTTKPFIISQLEHRGGKKLSQRGTEFFHKEHEVRKHPTRGFRGRKG